MFAIFALIATLGPGIPLAIYYSLGGEFDYSAGAEQALSLAGEQGWTVVSVKHDWSTVSLQSPPDRREPLSSRSVLSTGRTRPPAGSPRGRAGA